MQVDEQEIKFTYARSSGPGGQKVNKTSSKAVLSWDVSASPSVSEAVRQRFLAKYSNQIGSDGKLTISSERFRSQDRNRSDCLNKLTQMLATVAMAPKKRKKTRPTKAAVEKRLDEKKRHSAKKANRKFKSEF